MTAETGRIVLAFVDYVAALLLLGASLFPFYSGVAPGKRRSLAVEVRPALFAGALLVLASGIAELVFAIASGQEIALRAETIAHGSGWALRLLLGAGLICLLLGRMAPWRLLASLALSLVLLASIVWFGHAGKDTSPTARPHLIFDAFHIIAAGAWFGALCCFAGFSLAPQQHATPDALRRYHDTLAGFSGVGPVVIASLILSGIFLIGLQKISSDAAADYNRILLAKLVMFGAMLLLAAANRFWLTPRLSAGLETGHELAAALRALRMSLLAETALGVLVLVAVTWLGRFPAP